MFVRLTSASLLVIIAASVAACGGGTQDEAPQTGGEQAGPAAQVENAGRINGMVNFAGTPPANAAIDMSEEATCAQKHTDPPTAETVIANNGKLQNVFVYVKEGLSGSFSPPSQAVEIDQDGCVYMPHVTGVMTGQQLVFRNSDGILHNIKATPSEQPGFNISQPNNMTSTRTLRAQEVMVPVQCDVHGWMEAYVGVVDHPYFAVSGEDGSFTIENLPPGTYTVEAWHEKYGTQTQQVTVGANETVDLAFDYNASMASAVVPMGRPIDPHGSHAPARAGGE
jgi:plastocyanin